MKFNSIANHIYRLYGRLHFPEGDTTGHLEETYGFLSYIGPPGTFAKCLDAVNAQFFHINDAISLESFSFISGILSAKRRATSTTTMAAEAGAEAEAAAPREATDLL